MQIVELRERRITRLENIDVCYCKELVVQELPPTLRWRFAGTHHVLGNGSFGHIESEQAKLRLLFAVRGRVLRKLHVGFIDPASVGIVR